MSISPKERNHTVQDGVGCLDGHYLTRYNSFHYTHVNNIGR